MMRPAPSRLREVLSYDRDTGIFTWRVRVANRIYVGDIAGGVPNSNGYIRIRVDGYQAYAHQWAWFYETGQWPLELDHRNGLRTDNKFDNLREVERLINAQNLRVAHADSSTGLLGVERHRDRFHARITLRGRRHYLGSFLTAAQAHQAYLAAKPQLHAGCTI